MSTQLRGEPLKMQTKKTAQTALFAALSIIFGYVENLFPLPIPVFGAKLGISNIVILCALYMLGIPYAWGIMFFKTLCSALLFGNFSVFLYSVFGGIVSLFVMSIFRHSRRFGIVGTSAAGGAAHNLGQLLCAMAVMRTEVLLYYLPALLFIGTAAGTVIGLLVQIILKNLHKNIYI